MAPAIPILLAVLIAIPVGIIALIYLIVPLFKAIGFVIRQAVKFIGGEIGDALRIVGALITQVVLIPMILINVLFGRWSASAHFGRALGGEFKAVGASLYRILIG